MKIFWSLITLMAIMGIGVLGTHPDWIVDPTFQKVSALSNPNGKGDDPCTGQETAGRCADKCPNSGDKLLGYDPIYKTAICQSACPDPNAQGTYYPMGNDSSGKTVCGFSYYHECPYAAHEAADSEICKKLGAEQQTPAPTAVNQPVEPVQNYTEPFQGK